MALHLLDQGRDIEGQIRVGGRSMFRVMGSILALSHIESGDACLFRYMQTGC